MKKLIIVVVLFSLIAPLSAAESGPVLYKDPMVSLIFSSGLPGLGQLYCTQYKRGTFIMLTELVLIGGAAYPMARDSYVEYQVIDIDGNPVTLAGHKKREWEDISKADRRQVISCGLAALGLYIWNLFDAYEQAEQHNQQLAANGPRASLVAGRPALSWQLPF